MIVVNENQQVKMIEKDLRLDGQMNKMKELKPQMWFV